MSASQDSQEELLDQKQAETIIEKDAEPSSNYPKKMSKAKEDNRYVWLHRRTRARYGGLASRSQTRMHIPQKAPKLH